MKIFLTIAVCAFLAACGGSSGSESEKDLFSLWTESADKTTTLDLSGASFSGYRELSFIYDDGAQCNCRIGVSGNQNQGTYYINTCIYSYASSANGDPGCNELNHAGTYAKTTNRLEICDSENSCTGYE
jgi:hypothetical protein